MSKDRAERTIKLPDVGEGVAEAELVEWHVKVGDLVREDAVLAAVMTDKATVEIPAPADGEITWLGAEVGDTVAVGSPLVRMKVAGEGDSAPGEQAQDEPQDTPTPNPSPQGGGGQPAAVPHSSRSEISRAKGSSLQDSAKVTEPASPSPLWGGDRSGGPI